MLAIAAAAAAAASAATPPHLLFLLVDDLGSAGVGFSSPLGEPITPHIDELAREGAVLSRHYTYKFCSPTRSSFLSGRLPVHVNQINHPPYEPGGGVPPNMTALPRMLQKAGYVSHHAGKWHAGMSRPEQLPVNRGFSSSLAMLSGAADHYTNVREGFVDMWLDRAPARGLNGTYSLYRYTAHAIAAVQKHDTSVPMFLYMAFQDTHGPTEAPEKFLALYNNSIYKPRHLGLGQISAVDEGIKNVTDAFKAKGMWANTLVVFSSDNGGPHDHESNYPLRGSKGSDFEGGVRVVAFVSGGWLPAGMHGATINAPVHICDWYGTFAALAGVDPTDHEAASAGLPPIDSLDMTDLITGRNSTSPRVEIPLSSSGLISGKYKLVLGQQSTSMFPGPTTPNSTDDGGKSAMDCGAGCLFDLESDYVEHVDLAASRPDVLKELSSRFAELQKSFYQSPGSSKKDPASVTAAKTQYGGFWGPWQPDGPYPTPPPATGFTLVNKASEAQCLRASGEKKASSVVLGKCDDNAHWNADSEGRLYLVKGKSVASSYLRQRSSPNCTSSGSLDIGILGGYGGIDTKLQDGKLVLESCDGLCIGIAGGEVAVCGCNEPAAAGWRAL